MREADIRPADVLNEYLRLSADDARTFFPDRTAFVPRACPACDANEPAPAFEKHGFDLVSCRRCESLYVDPVPTAERLDSFYRDSPSTRYWANVFFPAVAEARRSRIYYPRAKRTLTLAEEAGVTVHSVADVGAGAGIFLEEIVALLPDVRPLAVEPGHDLVSSCRKKGFETFPGFVEEALAEWGGRADLVTCFEVIEHVFAPAPFVAALGALARPGGLIVISGLCGDGFDIRTLGARSKAVSPPHHLNFMSRKGVETLVKRAGLTFVSFSTPGLLDVDIVLNALREDKAAVEDDVLRAYLLDASEGERAALQERLISEQRSSHMWIVAQRPSVL